RPVSNAPDGPLPSCMEKIQKALNAKSLFSVMNRLETLSKQKGLGAHISPSGTACYITSNMFYIEVQLEKDGKVMDVKLAHLGETPVVKMKNYDAFGKILEDLSNLYKTPGNSEMKAKGYLALQALEKDLFSMSLLDRTQDVNRITEVLHGKVGHLVPRAGGMPMNIEFYISPYQVLEEELNPGAQVCGTKAIVIVEGTDTLHKLPLSPLLVDSQAGEDSNPAFLPLTDELSMDLLAFFVLKFYQPIPMSSSSMEEIQRLTGIKNHLFSGIQVTALKMAPLYELIVQCALKEKCGEDSSTPVFCFFVSLPDCPKQCYFINKGSEKSDVTGALVSKIPFSHPKCVPGVIEILRQQVAFNTLISSCVSEKHTNEDDSELLYFEVVPHKNTSFSVFFPHPVKENLASVLIDVITSREVQCHLHLHPQDPSLNSSDDFITRALKRQVVLLFPVVMRAIFRNAAKVKAES
ncbi:MED1 polymerase, partial [Urocolius indicus]|nr:MED1 polymerase [Urocolius indicus]